MFGYVCLHIYKNIYYNYDFFFSSFYKNAVKLFLDEAITLEC